MAQWCSRCGVEVWAYCLMPNHVHLIVVPESEDGLRRAIGEAHRRYTRHVNFSKRWRGHLWQGRFASYVLGEPYLLRRHPQGVEKLQAHERTGGPLGNDAFVAKLEGRLQRLLRPRKPGRKPKETNKRPKK